MSTLADSECSLLPRACGRLTLVLFLLPRLTRSAVTLVFVTSLLPCSVKCLMSSGALCLCASVLLYYCCCPQTLTGRLADVMHPDASNLLLLQYTCCVAAHLLLLHTSCCLELATATRLLRSLLLCICVVARLLPSQAHCRRLTDVTH